MGWAFWVQLGLTAGVAALDPIQVVARLPSAATLRNEVLS